MKKSILTLLLLATALTVAAQRYNHNSRTPFFSDKDHYYGLRLGINSASLSSDDVNLDLNARAGLNVGAVYGLQLTTSAPIWLEAGLFYSEKGGKINIQGDKTTVRIGHENAPSQLAGASVVAARVGRGAAEGVVAIIGPTRMDYAQVIRAVHTARAVLGDE